MDSSSGMKSSLTTPAVASAPRVPGARPHILAAIPCLNEELAIGGVVLRARQHADKVLVIDDGSTDKTAENARLAGATVIPNERNMGKGAGIRAALRYARANGFGIVVLLDGDGQHNPDEIPLVLEPLVRDERRADLALGLREGERFDMPRYRKLGKAVLDVATAVRIDGQLVDSQCGFRAMGPRAIEVLSDRLRSDDFAVESEMLTLAQQHDLRMENVPVHCKYAGIDGSTKNPVTHGAGVLENILIALTMRRPLITLGLPGLVIVLIGGWFAIRMLSVYNDTQFFVMSYALAAATLAIVGSIAIATALMMNMLILMRKTFGTR